MRRLDEVTVKATEKKEDKNTIEGFCFVDPQGEITAICKNAGHYEKLTDEQQLKCLEEEYKSFKEFGAVQNGGHCFSKQNPPIVPFGFCPEPVLANHNRKIQTKRNVRSLRRCDGQSRGGPSIARLEGQGDSSAESEQEKEGRDRSWR
jgi:hypothetical protein